jgi:peptide/nickel transport system permease protein
METEDKAAQRMESGVFPSSPPFFDRTGLSLIWGVLRHLQGAIGTVLLVGLVLMAILAPVVAPFDPEHVDVEKILNPPNSTHWLGTDELGRDITSRIIFGSRVTLQVVLLAVSLSLIAGTILGFVAGYLGRAWDAIIMRVVDALLAIPPLILALAIIAALGPDLWNTALAISLAKLGMFARLVRGEVLSLKSMEFVKAARAVGSSGIRISVKHIWPNAAGNVIVFSAVIASSALIIESALSFLGLGAQPPTPSWGSMVATGMQYWTLWWMSIFPGAAIFLAILSFNFLGDALRDVMDKRLMDTGSL